MELSVCSGRGGGWGEPGGRVGIEVHLTWKMPREQHQRKSVTLAKCTAHVVGWVRVHRKQGLLEMPVGSPFSHASPLLTAKYGPELEQGHVLQLFSSERTQVVSGMAMQEGEERLYSFEVTLPPVLPPSFKGKSFSVAYAIVVEAQLQGVGNITPPPKLVHIPLQLRSRRPPTHLHRLHQYCGPGGISHDFQPATQSISGGENPLHEEPRGLAGEGGEGLDRGGEQRFVIRIGEELVMVLVLSQKVYMCGECVVAALDFAGAERSCKKVIMSLESHETLLLKPQGQRTEDRQHPMQTTLHATATELTVDTKSCQVLLPVPPSAPATLHTTIGSIAWTLRLQITSSGPKDPPASEGMVVTWSAPLEIAPLSHVMPAHASSTVSLTT